MTEHANPALAVAHPNKPTTHGLLPTVDGQQIYWEEWGNPAGTPALYLHGGPGGTLGKSSYRHRFDLNRSRVVALEQRGCGRSLPHASDPTTDLSTNTTTHLISDIEQLREARGIDRWIVNGVSWGSTLALAYAQAHPERVIGIVLFAVTTTRREEVDWITEGVGAIFPEAWDRFASHAEMATPATSAANPASSRLTPASWAAQIPPSATPLPASGHCGRTPTSRSAPAPSAAILAGTTTTTASPSPGSPPITGPTMASSIRSSSTAWIGCRRSQQHSSTGAVMSLVRQTRRGNFTAAGPDQLSTSTRARATAAPPWSLFGRRQMNVFSSITRGSTSATTHQRNPLRRRRYPTHPSATRKYACVYSSDVTSITPSGGMT